MAGQHLKDTPRRTTQPAAVYAVEIADLMVRYKQVALTNWRAQDEIWKEMKKKLAQYEIAKTREDKQKQKELWETEKNRKIEQAQQKAQRQKEERRARKQASQEQ